jgi:hypothetical protein
MLKKKRTSLQVLSQRDYDHAIRANASLVRMTNEEWGHAARARLAELDVIDNEKWQKKEGDRQRRNANRNQMWYLFCACRDIANA